MSQSKSIVPEFTKDLPIERGFKIHIAIDFGTDGIGMIWNTLQCVIHYITNVNLTKYTALAYAIDGKVFVHTEWETLKYSVDEKPKTIILLDENYNALGFGKDAKHTLSNPS